MIDIINDAELFNINIECLNCGEDVRVDLECDRDERKVKAWCMTCKTEEDI